MSITRVFYDSEFTGLTAGTTLISIGLVTPTGAAFYAEFTDYDRSQVDDFIARQVLANTVWLNGSDQEILQNTESTSQNLTTCCGDRRLVRQHLENWLGQLGNVQVWADHVSYDWVLFCELFGGALHIPAGIHYIPMDLCTFLSCHGYDSDCNRAAFAGDYAPAHPNDPDIPALGRQHNALYDARMSLGCFNRVVAEQKLDIK